MKKLIIGLIALITGTARSSHVELTPQQKKEFSAQRMSMLKNFLEAKQQELQNATNDTHTQLEQEITNLKQALTVAEQSNQSLSIRETS